MTNKNINRCSRSLVIREMQMKTAKRYFTPTRLATFKKMNNNKGCQGPSSYEAALEHFSPDEDMKEATSQLKTLVDTLSPKAKDSVLELMVHGSLHTCCPCPWAAVSPTLGHACMLSRAVVSNSATPWTVARQAPLPMQFSKQEYWCCAVLSHSVMSNSL